MSTRYSAVLCFGFKVDDHFLASLTEDAVYLSDLILDEDGLNITYHGSNEEEMSCVLCIKKSIIYSNEFEGPYQLPLKKLQVGEDWSDKLKEFAKKNKMIIGKIGWWLCCEVR